MSFASSDNWGRGGQKTPFARPPLNYSDAVLGHWALLCSILTPLRLEWDGGAVSGEMNDNVVCLGGCDCLRDRAQMLG
ncbi:hypothetical protein JTE90_008963 [Oedothorax gibbosus]|uniref:Uncharacterized protein n=1 Tax=Oedothorax gibbosus TaxID=931172 RepID=A0AAV6UWX8_9ARAC|nr:hypothetical protein JTE90_008963 [Oedothorax gibbosus]